MIRWGGVGLASGSGRVRLYPARELGHGHALVAADRDDADFPRRDQGAKEVDADVHFAGGLGLGQE